MSTHEDRRGARRWWAALAASCALLVGAGWQLVDAPASPRPDAAGWIVAPAPETGTETGTGTPRPTTRPPAARSGARPLWSSAPAAVPAARPSGAGAPRRLIIGRLGVSMPVVATGLTTDGQMALPDHPRDVGWYRYGARPGDRSGSVVLGGHVDSRVYGTGPLAALDRLQRGDRIVVQQGRGQQTYAVRSVQLVSKRRLPVDELFDRTGSPVLRILTCGGPYDPGRGGYQDNLVVTAVPR